MGEEVIQCEPYLHDQIDRIKPEIIIAMGRFAAQALLKSTASIAELRGQRHEYSKLKIPLVVTVGETKGVERSTVRASSIRWI